MKIITTHNGGFHTDDVFAVAILKLIYPKSKIIRTRDWNKLKQANIRVDVGRKYNPKTGDFDHHQEEFKKKRKNRIPYTSAGLIWLHYGKKLVKSRRGFDYIDKKIIQPIDANDSGVNYFTTKEIEPYTIDNIINAFDPVWKEKRPTYEKEFKEAVSFATNLLKKEIKIANTLDDSDKKVRKALERAKKNYIVFNPPTPEWKEILIKESKIKFVIYEYAFGNRWCVEAVPKEFGKFSYRKLFPKEWADLIEKELAEETGVPDACFCHKDRFIACAYSKKGAIRLVELALKTK